MERIIRHEQCVIRLATVEIGLIFQMPAETLKTGCMNFSSQPGLVSIKLHAWPFHPPEIKKTAKRIDGGSSMLLPFRFKRQAMLKPVI